MNTPPELASLLNNWIRSEGHDLNVKEKLDVLDRAVEWMRFELRHGRNQLDMDTFLRSELAVKDGGLKFTQAAPKRDTDKGTAPLHLQPKLLLYLLLYHREGAAPLEVIDGLIAKIAAELRPTDFVRTKTGVTRCYTNTRFAANTLRNYGFLRFTIRERYKYWVLTLPGIVAAAHFLTSDGWKIPDTRREAGKELHIGIYHSLGVMKSYDVFLRTLNNLLRDDSGVFETFGDALKTAHDMLLEFNLVSGNTGIKYADRQTQCRYLMDRLDHHLGPDFYEEFSAAMNIESLIQSVDQNSD